MPRKNKIRLDEILVARGLADNVPAAQAMIMAGDVIVDDQRVDKPGTRISDKSQIRTKESDRFVSRGGSKLDYAILDLGLSSAFEGSTVLDVGASTGGFTDCVLSHGARKVIAIDVGTAQLAWKLRNDPRVECIENMDIKDYQPDSKLNFDWVVTDVSFTSLSRLLPSISKVAQGANLLLLVKPQFELPKEKVPLGGVVTNDGDRREAVNTVTSALENLNYQINQTVDARVHGAQGNREIFVYASRRV